MIDFPKISIITPTYNSANSLDSCLLSVANQEYENKEHLIVDARSEDDTLDIVIKFAERYPHIKWVSEKDSGIYEAMNKGIRLCTGDWVYFLGSDDILLDNQVLTKIFRSDVFQQDIVYGNVLWGATEKVYDGSFSKFKLIEKNICQQSIFYKKEVFAKLGYFEPQYTVLADWVFNMKWFNDETIKWKYIENVIATYGITGHSSQKTDPVFLKNMGHLIQTYFPGEYVEIYQSLRDLREKTNRLNQDLANKDQIIHEKEKELFLIKATKFWKIRDIYIKIITSIRGK